MLNRRELEVNNLDIDKFKTAPKNLINLKFEAVKKCWKIKSSSSWLYITYWYHRERYCKKRDIVWLTSYKSSWYRG